MKFKRSKYLNWSVLAVIVGLVFLFQNCSQGFTPWTNFSQSISSVVACTTPSAAVTAGNGLYQQNCASCHGGITTSSVANKTALQIQTAFSTISQMNGLSATVSSSDISSIAAALAVSPGAPTCPSSLSTSNFTRSSSEVIATRVGILFPTADTSTLVSTTATLGQALGLPDFLTSFSVVQPDSASAQASFQKYVASNYCKTASSASTIFSTSDILMDGETLPTDANTLMAFSAARNVWLSPYLASSTEVQLLTTLITNMQTDGAATSEVQQAVCLAALSAPQFWIGNPGKFEAIKRVALEIGRRRPAFSEFSDYNAGTITLANFVEKIQTEPNYLDTVKTWHRNWLGIKDYSKTNDRRRGYKYWWALGGAATIAGQDFVAQAPTGSLDPTIPIIRQGNQNTSELSDTESCQPVPQAFNPVTQRIQWEHRVNGTWYVVGGSKLVSGVWQNFGGSVPVGGSMVTTALTDIVQAKAIVNKVSFSYATGALAKLPAFAATDRRVRRFTIPDDIDPNAASPSTEQNGYSVVNTWWSGAPVYICNSLYRFVQACAYRPAKNGVVDGPQTWSAASPMIVEHMGGNSNLGVDSLGNGTVLSNMYCSMTVSPTQITYAQTGSPNSTIINGEPNFSGDGTLPSIAPTKYASLLQERTAEVSIYQDMADEPLNLVADIVSNNNDYRNILTADYTFARGPLEIYYRTQGQYLTAYPPGLTRAPASTGFMTSEKIQPMAFTRLPHSFFQNSTGGEVSGDFAHALVDGPVSARSVIDSPTLTDLAPRPISGVLTQAGFMGSSVPKMRSLSAKILRTFTCGEVDTFKPTAAQGALQVQFIPTSEASGAQHVDPKGACFACHINMDPLASAISKGFLMTINPFTNKPLPNGANWLYGFGEIAPFATDDVQSIGMKYGVRGNMDLPSQGALFGQTVTGIREVGQVLSQSDLFAQCAVTQAFTSVFGRPPSLPEDQPLLDTVKQTWIDSGYSYNKLIELLVISPQYQVRN